MNVLLALLLALQDPAKEKKLRFIFCLQMLDAPSASPGHNHNDARVSGIDCLRELLSVASRPEALTAFSKQRQL